MNENSEYGIDTINHYIMSIVGGFLGCYALLLRGNFGSAQTGNLIQLIIDIQKMDLIDVLLRFTAFGVFVATLAVALLMTKRNKIISQKTCILLEVFVIMTVGLIPVETNEMLALLPIFIIAAFQWGNFNGTEKYSSPTLFTTGNLRNCTFSWVEYYLGREPGIKTKAIFYSQTLLSYHLGVVVGILLINIYNVKSIWFCIIPLLVVYSLIIYSQRSAGNFNECILDDAK